MPQFRAAGIVDPQPWYWTEWGSGQPSQPLEPRYPAGFAAQLKPTDINFPLDPFKAADAQIRKFDDRFVGSVARNWWTFFYNKTVTRYTLDPNDLMKTNYLDQFAGPNEGFTPADVRYVNWRFLMSNNTDAVPPVSPSIETFSFAYRFQRVQ